MISDPCPEPQSEIPEIADVESWELSREEQIDAFCAEFQAVLTQLDRSPAAWRARARARFN